MKLQANDPLPGGSSRSGCSTSITSTTIVDNQCCDFYKHVIAIIAHEATDTSNSKQISIVLRYVDAVLNIREEFLGFKECTI